MRCAKGASSTSTCRRARSACGARCRPRVDIVEQLFARARRRPRRIVLPEVEDERIREAAQRLKSEGLAEPLLPSEPYSSLAKYVPLYPGNPKVAERAIRKPLIHAGMMVKAGDADALLAGVAHPTARVIEAGLLTIGLSPGIKTPSSFFLMVLPHRIFVYADCAVNAEPDAEALADIALAGPGAAGLRAAGERSFARRIGRRHRRDRGHPFSSGVRKQRQTTRSGARQLRAQGLTTLAKPAYQRRGLGASL